jgi:hypothetical protein
VTAIQTGIGTGPRRRRNDSREYGLWFLLAILLHAILAFILYFFTPLPQLIDEAMAAQPDPDRAISRSKVEQVATHVEQAATEQMREKVEVLQATVAQLDEVRKKQAEAFQPVLAERREDAPDALEAALAEAEAKMEAAKAALDEDALGEASQEQSAAEDAQERAAGELGLLGEADSEVQEALDAANAAQRDASDTTAKLKEATDTANRLRPQVEKHQSEVEKNAAKLERYETQLAERTEAITAARAKIEEEKAAREAAEQAVKDADNARKAAESARKRADSEAEKAKGDAKASANEARDKARAAASEAKKAFDAAKKDRDRAKWAVEKTDREIRDHKKKIDEANRRIREAKYRLGRETPQLEKKAPVLAEAEAEAAKLSEQAGEKQAEALALQKKAAAAARGAAAELEGTELPADEDFEPLQLAGLDAVELHDAAAELEQKAADAYAEVKATRLAALSGLTPKQARDRVDVALPERPGVDEETLRKDPTTDAALQQKKDAFAAADREVAGMAQLAGMFLSDAIAEADRGLGEELPSEAIASTGTPGGEATDSTSEDSDGTGGAMAIRKVTPIDRVRDLASVDRSGQVSDLTAAMADAMNLSLGSVPNLPQDARTPPSISKASNPAAGRVLGDGPGATYGDWMAITDWWVIGPYDNAARRNRDRKFTPENLVDLSAVYAGEGKDGIDLRWTFHTAWHRDTRGLQVSEAHAKTLKRNPPWWFAAEASNRATYGVWYAYTEIEFPTDAAAYAAWVAMASDDKGRAWVLDPVAGNIPIWESANHHKSWVPGEAVRLVLFRPGVNRILFRVENGYGTSEWSMLVRPVDPATDN